MLCPDWMKNILLTAVSLLFFQQHQKPSSKLWKMLFEIFPHFQYVHLVASNTSKTNMFDMQKYGYVNTIRCHLVSLSSTDRANSLNVFSNHFQMLYLSNPQYIFDKTAHIFIFFVCTVLAYSEWFQYLNNSA